MGQDDGQPVAGAGRADHQGDQQLGLSSHRRSGGPAAGTPGTGSGTPTASAVRSWRGARRRPPAGYGCRAAAPTVVAQRDLLLAGAGVDLLRQPDRRDGAEDEDQERVAQCPLRAHGAASPAIGAEIAAPTMPASETRPLAFTSVNPRQQSGHGGGAGHAVRLGRDEYAERCGIQQRRVVGDRACEHPAEERADREGRADRPAASAAEPVEERADQRSDDRERSIVSPRNSATWAGASPWARRRRGWPPGRSRRPRRRPR